MRIGLFAMSGIRACDPDLLALGMTLPGVVDRGRVIAQLPSLGLLTVAGMGSGRHEMVYHEVDDIRAWDELPGGYDLVAISSLSAQVREGYALADRFRARGIPVVMGGLHVSSLPDEAAAHCDAVAVGEGESVWTQILDDAERGRLGGIYRASGAFPLENATMPAFDLLDHDRYHRLTIQVSRGCPFQCEFCASSILIRPRYSMKPIERVLAEIDRVREIWRRPFIEFADDNALVKRSYWKRLLTELKSRRVRWFAETDLSVHEDEELLTLMRESGCAQVLIGLESPDETGLKGLELSSDWKRKQASHYLQAIQRIQSHGIRVNGCFILGLDEHGPEIFDRVYEFAVKAELFDVQITMLTPFPGTPLYRRLKREGRLLHHEEWERCTLFDVNYEPKRMSVEELRAGFRSLTARLYSEELTNWRKEIFLRKYLVHGGEPSGIPAPRFAAGAAGSSGESALLPAHAGGVDPTE
jgi:radical SAM superfamily enzyme YgiQ (UPF0313 family)